MEEEEGGISLYTNRPKFDGAANAEVITAVCVHYCRVDMFLEGHLGGVCKWWLIVPGLMGTDKEIQEIMLCNV